MFRVVLGIFLVGAFTCFAACGSSQSKPGDPGAKPAASEEPAATERATDKMR